MRLHIIVGGCAGFALGAAMMYLVTLEDNRAGILPLFPVFALLLFVMAGLHRDSTFFAQTAWTTARTIPAYLAFVVFCSTAIALRPSLVKGNYLWIVLLTGVGVWTAVTLVTEWVSRRFS